MNPALKRVLWCRWFHRWHPVPIPVPPPGTPPTAAILISSKVRRYCRACDHLD